MKRLLTIDEHNYTEDMPVFRRWNVRAVIFRDGKLAMERSSAGEYKFPGGSVDPGESWQEALCREVREETGLLVRPDSITELGEILERRKDLFQENLIYECHSLYFRCEVEERTMETALTRSEVEQGLLLHWAAPEEIAAVNEAFLHKPWIARDTAFLKLWRETSHPSSALPMVPPLQRGGL